MATQTLRSTATLQSGRDTWSRCSRARSVSHQSSLATIGDMPDEVLMFQQNGLSIAIGNAIAEVQRQTEFVAASNKEEGFASAMEVLILGEFGEFEEKMS
jgi:3-deoxy-D-manno-octulosonate 8-phosphate phosphatase KdsC-like HAD superfamily phosphatase